MKNYVIFIVLGIVFLLSNNAYATCVIPDNTDISVITGCFDLYDKLGNPSGTEIFYYEMPFNLLIYCYIILFLCYLAFSVYKMIKK